MSLADYLAKKYLTADPAPEKKSKKRKRKTTTSQTESTGLVIADDDNLGWDTSANVGKDDDDTPMTVIGSTAEFRRAKKSAWQTIGAPTPSSADQAAADAIISSAAAENALQGSTDDAPAIADAGGTDTAAAANVLKMESGAHAGLQTAEQVTKALAQRQAAERARFAAEGDAHSGRGQETIYRDASGRIINVAMKRAEARKAAEAEEAKAAAQVEAQKGAVQLSEAARRRQELKDAKYIGVSRYADDIDLNAELKEKERWNDPAARFLSTRKEGKSVSGRPLYKGPFVPNRYGIRPGHRWDGVDRGNGFEKEYFAARNRRKNVKELEYAWQMDE